MYNLYIYICVYNLYIHIYVKYIYGTIFIFFFGNYMLMPPRPTPYYWVGLEWEIRTPPPLF